MAVTGPAPGAGPLAPVTIRRWTGAGRATAALSVNLWIRLVSPPDRSIPIRAGARRAWARVVPLDDAGGNGEVLALSADLLQALCLRDGVRLWLRTEGGAETDHPNTAIILGPFVGIMTRVVGPLLLPYLAAARDQAVPAFAFRAADVRWRAGVVLGWIPVGGRWRRVRCPLPNVVYDRTIGRWREERRGSLLARFRRHGVAVFNGPVGYKWHIHRLLSASEGLRDHLPATRRLRTAADARDLLQRFAAVYVKPERGFGGDGIVRVQAIGNGRFQVASVCRAGARWMGASALGRALRRLARKRPYLVQQELDLVAWRGRRFDVRVLLLRDAAGQWQVAGTAVRVGAAGSIVSNLRRGGRAYDPRRVLAEAVDGGPATAEALLVAIERIALAAAAAVGASLPAVGELGVDVGVDRSGRPWVIEVNPKPGRKSFARDDATVRRRVFGMPMAYARFLSGFGEPASPGTGQSREAAQLKAGGG